jgi:hypothetical protein
MALRGGEGLVAAVHVPGDQCMSRGMSCEEWVEIHFDKRAAANPRRSSRC